MKKGKMNEVKPRKRELEEDENKSKSKKRERRLLYATNALFCFLLPSDSTNTHRLVQSTDITDININL